MSEPARPLVADEPEAGPLTELEQLKADNAIHQLKRIKAAREVNILKRDLRKAQRKIHEQRKQLRSLGQKWTIAKRFSEGVSNFVSEEAALLVKRIMDAKTQADADLEGTIEQ